MESYGEILKATRESKNLDLDAIARELSITRQYLEGLESEDNSSFPGEAYFVGFLKNYSDYLGSDTDMILTLYRNKKLQESPVPEGLLEKRRPPYFIPLIAAVCVLGAALISAAVILCVKFMPKKESGDVVVDKNVTAKKYALADDDFTGRLYVGDQLVLPTRNGDVILTVCDTSDRQGFGLQTPVGTLYTELAEENSFDVDGDAVSDLIVYVSGISTLDSAQGAEVRLTRCAADIPGLSDIPVDTFAANRKTVILEDSRAYPFTVIGVFRGACVFRHRVDRRSPEEAYFTSGESVTMTANNGVRLWMSNCNAVKFSVTADGRNYDIELGTPGKVLAEDIKWVKDTDGRYKLVILELD